MSFDIRESTPNLNGRPLSPHLQVYKFQLSMAMSIFHRITGAALMVGTPFLIFWLSAAAYGEETYAMAESFFGSWFGYLVLLGFSFAMMYHLCNGVRHLIWDAGHGLTIDGVQSSGKITIAISVILWVLIWLVA